MSEVSDALAILLDRVVKYEITLKEIAKQKTTSEVEEEPDFYDWEDGFDSLVHIARNALRGED